MQNSIAYVRLNCFHCSLFIKYVLASFENLGDSETAAVVEEGVPESIEREADEEAEGSAKVGDQRDKGVTVNLGYHQHILKMVS